MTIGVAFLGTSHPHTSGRGDVFRRLPGVSLKGAYDRNPNVQSFAAYLGMAVRDQADLLADPDVHIILVHSETEDMVDYCIAALETGKAVLVEKPCGTGPADIKRLADAVRRTGGLLQAGFNFRHSPIVDLMKEIVVAGVIGEVTQVRAHGGCALGEHKTPMLNRPRDIGGAFFVIGCHIVDILLHVLGPPSEISATVSKFPKVSDHTSREDAIAACFVYENCLASIDYTAQDPLENVESWDFFFNGIDGVVYANLLPGRYRLFLRRPFGRFSSGWSCWQDTQFPVPWSGQATDFSPDIPAVANREFFSREADQFMSAFTTGRPVSVGSEHAYLVADTIETCYQSSIEGGRRLAFPRRG